MDCTPGRGRTSAHILMGIALLATFDLSIAAVNDDMLAADAGTWWLHTNGNYQGHHKRHQCQQCQELEDRLD